MRAANSIPRLPDPVMALLRPLPLFPLQLALGRIVTRLAVERPGIFARLDSHAEKTYLIDPTDLPFVFRLCPRVARPSLEVCRREAAAPCSARIAGSLAALLGMLHGNLDGDALFFSRDLVVEGDTEAVLALRNALDDAEIDLLSDSTALLGPAAAPLERMARGLLTEASRLSGVAMVRADR